MTLVAAEMRLKADPRLIIPLDFPMVDEARKVVDLLGDSISFYKVGLELFATRGMSLSSCLIRNEYGGKGRCFYYGSESVCRRPN